MRAATLGLVLLAGCGLSVAPSATSTFKPGPSATISSAPQAVVEETTARFELQSDRKGARFKVSLDGTILGTFDSPVVLKDLPDGPHQVWFWAKARDGSLGKVPATHSWTVDTKPPVLEVRFPPPRSLTSEDEIAVCGTAIEEGGVLRLLVNGVPARSQDGFRTWRAVVPVAAIGNTRLRVELIDVAGRLATDESRLVTTVAPPPPLPDEDAEDADEFELVMRPGTGEAVTVQSDCVIGIDPELGTRREISGVGRGEGEAFEDIVVMAAVPGRDAVAVFDTKLCRIFTVDLESGDRTIVWERLGPHDIPATREGFIACDGENFYVQGPREADLVELAVDGSARRVVAKAGWIQDLVALTADVARDRLLAVSGKTGHVYAVDPQNGSATVISSHDAEHPLGYARGIVVDGDLAYAVARDQNGVVTIDLDSGAREFLALLGDGLEAPRAIAAGGKDSNFVVLDHGRHGLMHVNLETGECREKRLYPHRPRPECGGPIHFDPVSRELCVLDAGRCALVGIDAPSTNQRVILNLAPVAPDAVDFAIHPSTGEPVVLERHGIYNFAPTNLDCVLEPGATSCTFIPPDPARPLGGALALRIDPDGSSAIILDSRPHAIDYGWIRSIVRHDEVVRINLATGKCTIVADRASTSMGETMSVLPGVFLEESTGRLWTGATNCGPYGVCINATLRLLDLGTGKASTVYGITSTDGASFTSIGGTTTPAYEFGAMVPDPLRNRVYTLDRLKGVVGYVDRSGAVPRYHVLSGDLPYYESGTGWIEIPHGHGPPLNEGQGLALDAEAGLLFVTSRDRVIVVDVEGGDRALAAVLE